MSEDKHVMILALATEWHTADSQLFDAECGHRCWISPASLAMLRGRHDIRTSCMPCTDYTPEDFTSGEVDVHEVPGQYESMSKLLGAEITDRVFKELGIERNEK